MFWTYSDFVGSGDGICLRAGAGSLAQPVKLKSFWMNYLKGKR